jgi:hypothetical protein
VHFLFGLIFKYEATIEQGLRSQGPTTRLARANELVERLLINGASAFDCKVTDVTQLILNRLR